MPKVSIPVSGPLLLQLNLQLILILVCINWEMRIRSDISPYHRLGSSHNAEQKEANGLAGMKNYIANESGGWATSTGYVKFSLKRSIHFGRVYTSGARKGQEKDLYEALRCLGWVPQP
jgi:hypothetical protein